MEFVSKFSASHCYSSALSGQTGEGCSPRTQFLFDNFKPFLNTSLTKFSHVRNNLSSTGRVLLDPSKKKGFEG